MTKTADLDSFDHALLEEMQRDNQTPARILAERVGLSQSAVLRRLRRLRAERVITADISIVNPAVLGVPVTIHVLVSLVRGSQLADAFAREVFHDDPNVSSFYTYVAMREVVGANRKDLPERRPARPA